jgi:hypothetical protein
MSLRRTALPLLGAAALALSLSACAYGTTPDLGSIGPEEDTGGDTGGGGPGLLGLDVDLRPKGYAWKPSGAWGPEACSEPMQSIYAVTNYGFMVEFNPVTKDFRTLGRLWCPGADSSFAISMAVGQDGVARVLFGDSSVQNVDLRTGTCLPSGVVGAHPFSTFGMAYAADPSSPTGESLFVRHVKPFDDGLGHEERKLGRVDFDAKTIHPIGDGEGADSDLSGTGDGRLYGFIKSPTVGGAASIAEYDTHTGEALNLSTLEGVTIGEAWAVAMWGGALWLFANEPGTTTRVYRHEPATGLTTLEVADAGMHIVGAGVSTCAPTSTTPPPPK